MSRGRAHPAASGNPGGADAVFIVQIGSTLTTASSSSVNLINGAQDCNVFWQVGSSATLGTSTASICSAVIAPLDMHAFWLGTLPAGRPGYGLFGTARFDSDQPIIAIDNVASTQGTGDLMTGNAFGLEE